MSSARVIEGLRSTASNASSLGRRFGSVSVDPMELALLADRLQARFEGDAQFTRLGRYRVGRWLGRGGFGTVFEGWDPRLGRAVALKVLRRAGEHQRLGRIRVEVEALSRLAHPNIVKILDLGEAELSGGAGAMPFLVLELVDGLSLDGWLRATSRTPAEIVRVMQAVGHGLAAAHAAGVLHLDIKPGNILIGHDHRPRLSDFGLARLGDATTTADASKTTQSGELGGTPLYMAPEQHRGLASASSDVYAWCLTTWQALTGQMPFATARPRRLLEAKLRPCFEVSAGDRFTRRVLRALEPGLAPEPQRRYASMPEALAAVARATEPPRYGSWLGASVALLIAAFAVGRLGSASRCDELEIVLSPTAADGLVEGLAPLGEAGARDVTVRLAGYANRWTEAARSTCASRESPSSFDVQRICLDHARHAFDTTAHVLQGADLDVASRAHKLVDGLPDPDRCAALNSLDALRMVPPNREAMAVAEVREQLSRIRVLLDAGRFDAAQLQLDEARSSAAHIDFDILAAELHVAEGSVSKAQSRWRDAQIALQRALSTGLQAKHWAVALEATQGLAFVGAQLHEHERASQYLRLAAGLDDRPGADALARAATHNVWGAASFRAERYDEALAEFRRALEILSGVVSSDHVRLVETRNNIGATLSHLGRTADAERELGSLARDLALRLGEGHPDVLAVRYNLALSLLNRGELDAAERELTVVLERREQFLGEAHQETVDAIGTLGNLMWSRQDYRAAESLQRKALAIVERRDGRLSAPSIMTLGNLALALHGQNRFPETVDTVQDALARLDALRLTALPMRIWLSSIAADALLAQGEHAAGVRMVDAALELARSSYDARHPDVMGLRLSRAEAWFQAGALDEARRELTAVVAGLAPMAFEEPWRSKLEHAEARLQAIDALQPERRPGKSHVRRRP